MSGCPHARNFDYWDDSSQQDPFPLYKEFRDAGCPVRSDEYGGHYLATRYEDVVAVARDYRTYISGEGVSLLEYATEYSMFPVETDKPLHDEYRRLLNGPLGPKEIAKLEPVTRRIANDLIDDFIESGECEITQDLASPLVTMIIAPFLGLDEEYWEVLKGGAFEMLYGEDKEKATKEFFTFITEQFQMRRDEPRDDFLTGLLTAQINDGGDRRHLTEHEQFSVVWSTVMAATDTTTGLTTTSLWYLSRHPDLKATFVADPSLIEPNLEEFVRMFTGVNVSRTVAEKTTLGGVDLEPDDKVVMMLGAAGRDERVFENPEEFVFDRRPNKHVGFGLGIHKCVGMHMARMQFKVMMEEVLTRVPDFETTTDDHVITAGFAWQVRTLPLRFAAGARRSALASH